jgi:cytochrome c oxidase subunit 3/cytochrome c oxidase subunit I+III
VTDYAIGRERRRVARPNGWWGMAVFVASEATLFGTIFGSYFYLRFNSPHWPPHGIEAPKVVVPLVLTGVLVATSVPMQLAFFAARAARIGLAWLFVFVSLVVQCGYFAMQIHLFLSDLDKFQPSGSAYASIYFTMLGAHHFHVFVGMLLNLWLLARLAGGLTNYRLIALQTTTFYWHFVNVLALCVVGAQLSAAV